MTTASATAARRKKRLIPSSARPASLRAARRAGADYGARATPDWRTTDFAAGRRWLEIAGRLINVIDIGPREGPPVVFIHGLAGSWKNWLENMPALAQERRVIALDLPGFGDSEMPADDITISAYAQCVEQVCAELGTGEVDVVGNSMGGFVVAELAIVHPERVRRLVLVDAAGISIGDLRRAPTRTFMRFVALQSTWATAQRQILLRRRLRHVFFRTIMRHPTRLALDLLAEQAGGPGKPGFLLAMDALLSYDFSDRLGEIAVPTLIIHGEDDMLVPLADGWEFKRLIPGSRLLILQDTGHVPMLERPLTFNQVVADFLR